MRNPFQIHCSDYTLIIKPLQDIPLQLQKEISSSRRIEAHKIWHRQKKKLT